MWTLLRFERSQRALHYGHGVVGRGHHQDHPHHRHHHLRSARTRHRIHPEDPISSCCNPIDKIVSCGVVSIAIGIITVIYGTWEMYKAGEFYDSNQLQHDTNTVLTSDMPPTLTPTISGRPPIEPPIPPYQTTPYLSSANGSTISSEIFNRTTVAPINQTETVFHVLNGTDVSKTNYHNFTTIMKKNSTTDQNANVTSTELPDQRNLTSDYNSTTTDSDLPWELFNSSSPSGLTAKEVKFEDKYGAEITMSKYKYLISQEQLDKGLCVALTFLGIIQVVSSGLLIRGAKLRDKRSFVPWIIIVSALMLIGLIYILFNIITLDFNASVNFVLFLWIVSCVIEFHCLKSVMRAFKTMGRENAREGSAVFDPRLSNDVFTITNGEIRPSESPVRIILKPPSYEEAVTALEELGPPPDPPDDDGKDVESPPEYTP